MDINSEIYPMKVDSAYNIVLAKSIYNDGSPTPKDFNYELFASSKSTLMDNFDYVMCGKVFQFSKEPDKEGGRDTLAISISFGGLILQISKLKKDEKTGKPKAFEDINLDDTLYLLLKKLPK